MFTFQKKERLKSRKVIGKIFKEGHSFISYPIRFAWVKMETPLSDFPLQMGLSVPKRNFSKAVDRNRLRRRIRESYRLNKHSIYEKLESESPNAQYGLMLIYVAKETLDFHQIEKAIQKGFYKLEKKITMGGQRRRTADDGRRTANGRRWTADDGRRTTDGGRRTADGGRRTTQADRK